MTDNKDKFNNSISSLFWLGFRLISTAFILGIVYISVWGIEWLLLFILEKSLSDLLTKSARYQEIFDMIKFGCGVLTGLMYLIHNVIGFISLIQLELETLKDD